eukprot:760497-Hanusia_phi.AAC.2
MLYLPPVDTNSTQLVPVSQTVDYGDIVFSLRLRNDSTALGMQRLLQRQGQQRHRLVNLASVCDEKSGGTWTCVLGADFASSYDSARALHHAQSTGGDRTDRIEALPGRRRGLGSGRHLTGLWERTWVASARSPPST